MDCALCHGNNFDPVSQIDSKSGAVLHVSLCANCGLIQQTPIQTSEELRIYYSHDYRVDYKKTISPKPKHVFRAANAAMDRVEFMHEAGIQGGRLLDVGAGGGELVYLSSKLGFDSAGIEPNVGYSEYAKLEYDCNVSTLEIDEVDGTFDVITMFHVMEHLPSPLRAFEKLHQLLNPDGWLCIEVPWIETSDASPSNIFFKAHIFYFSVDTMIACASRHFEVEKVDTATNLRVLFRPRLKPIAPQLPSTASVQAIRNRLASKGWLEYLIAGKGVLKPAKKAIASVKERRIRRKLPREIVDDIVTARSA